MSAKEKYKYFELPTDPETSQQMETVDRKSISPQPKYTTLALEEPSDSSTEPGGSGQETEIVNKTSHARPGVSNVNAAENEQEESLDEQDVSLVRRLLVWYKGLFVGSITDVEVANMIKAYGKPMKTFRNHRKLTFDFRLINFINCARCCSCFSL